MENQEFHSLLLRVYNHTNRRITEQTGRLGLFPGQPKVLEYLLLHDGCISRDICTGCVLDKSTMTSLLTRMEGQGLITKEAHAADKRAVCVYLTEKGRELAKRVRSITCSIDETALSGFPDEKKEAFLNALSEIMKHLEEPLT